MAFIDGKEYEQTSVDFRSYGILTLPILPLSLLILHVTLMTILPGFYFILYLITVVIVMRSKKEVTDSSKFLTRLVYVLVTWTFGIRTTKKNTHQFRIEWFLLFGGPMLGLILIFIYISTVLIIPAILVLIYRKKILRFAFKFALLPRSEYFEDDLSRFVDDKELVRKEEQRVAQDKELQYTTQNQFLQFYPPSRRARFNAYAFLLLTPILFVIIFSVFVALVSINRFEANATDIILETAGIVFVWGYIGIIPYMFLTMMRNKRITRFVTTSFAESLVTTMTSKSVSYIPILNGEYYIEHNSRILDMSDKNGFYEIFSNGRIYTIILLPLAAISFIFSQLIKNANTSGETISVTTFLKGFTNAVQDPTLALIILIIIPLFISFVLPLIWVLKDAELKRIGWEDDYGGSDQKEISSVEDLGQTINRIFGLFLGFSTITGLASVIGQLVDEDVGTTNVYIIVAIMVLLGAILVLPGTLYFAYRYFSLGDHARGVNYIRYNLSQNEKIGVGTIVKGYSSTLTLPEPNSPYIREQIGLDTVMQS